MKDQEYAKKILEYHKRGGYSIRLAIRPLLTKYIFTGLLAILSIYIISLCPRSLAFFWIIIGLYLGMLLRDIGWFLAIKRTWPFSEKITDWDKVERLARGESK